MTHGPPPGHGNPQGRPPGQGYPQGPPPGYRPPAGPPPGYRPPAGPPPAGPPPGNRPPPGPPPRRPGQPTGYGYPQGPPPGYGPAPGYRPPAGPRPGYGYPQGPPPSQRPPAGPYPGYQGAPPAPQPAHQPPFPGQPQPPNEHAGAADRQPAHHRHHDADSSSSTLSQEDVLAPRSGKVGDLLEGDGSFGLRAGWRVLSIDYPADEVFVQAGLQVPEGYASVIIGALFTNKGAEQVEIVPARGLCVIDSDGGIRLAAAAHVESHPGFREGAVMPEETLAGHLFYLIDKNLDVRGAQWRDGADTLTWLR